MSERGQIKSYTTTTSLSLSPTTTMTTPICCQMEISISLILVHVVRRQREIDRSVSKPVTHFHPRRRRSSSSLSIKRIITDTRTENGLASVPWDQWLWRFYTFRLHRKIIHTGHFLEMPRLCFLNRRCILLIPTAFLLTPGSYGICNRHACQENNLPISLGRGSGRRRRPFGGGEEGKKNST